MAAKLNFGLDGDKSGDLDLDLGEVEPGDSGTVDITVNNVGTIPGNLCVTKESFSPNIEVQTTDTCGETVDPGGFVLYEIKWTLPLTAHNTGLGGDFQFSYSFLFENGFKITRQVVLKGKLFDPTDTPTMTRAARSGSGTRSPLPKPF